MAILVVWQLFIPPVLSIADNNAFQKLAGRQCLGPAPGKAPVFFDYATDHWYFSPGACMNWPFRSTAEGVVLAAVGLNRVCGHTGEFDSRFMGFWYGLILCIGFFLLQMLYGDFPATVSTLALCAWIAASCSAVYVPWFNTFYFDALTLAALTAALVGVGRVVLQNRVGPDSSVGRVLARLDRGGADAVFSALFYRVLPASAEPERILAATQTPASWAVYSGQHAFEANGPHADPRARAQFTEWFGPLDLFRLYFRHPLAAWHVAKVNLDESSPGPYEASAVRLCI